MGDRIELYNYSEITILIGRAYCYYCNWVVCYQMLTRDFFTRNGIFESAVLYQNFIFVNSLVLIFISRFVATFEIMHIFFTELKKKASCGEYVVILNTASDSEAMAFSKSRDSRRVEEKSNKMRICCDNSVNGHLRRSILDTSNIYFERDFVFIEDKHRKKIMDNVNCKLKTRAMDLTLENFETLHKTQVFLNLPTNTVIEILKSDDLIVPSEEDVFNAVKLWVNHNDANRYIELAQLMGSVRLSLLSTKFLVKEVMTFCHSCAECLTSIRQVIKDKNDKFYIQRDTPRRKKVKIALVGGNYLDGPNTIEIYDVLKKRWTLSKDIGFNKIFFSSVVVGDWLVIIGGYNSSEESLTSVEYIDLKNGQKHPLKPLNHARKQLSAVTRRCRDSSTDVYAIGGDDSRKSVERWNSKIGNWKIIAPLLVAVDGHSASVIDGKIFVTGGVQTFLLSSTNKVQMYSVKSNSWTYRADMIQGRCFHSNVVIKGKLFIGGGFIDYLLSFIISVEQYDPIADVWTAFTELPNPTGGISLCCFQNKLLSMGGHIQWYGHSSKVWEYDETNMSWKVSSHLSKERTSAAAHVIPYDSIIWAPQQQLSADNLTPTIQQLGADNSTTEVSIARTILRKINFFKFFFRK
ncbi:uncharacterized protein LOC143917345 [Arctopsyche grandis]|uniref:uncharacterized protein LOC143917345 n=1 Tax=Arctopsyche grandis TaxID=121162 RepID=UPI00406D9127